MEHPPSDIITSPLFKTQIAGLISALMAMIVTLWLGFLLESLPTVTPLTCFPLETKAKSDSQVHGCKNSTSSLDR